MRTSRVMPPAVAVAHDTTKTPNRSSRCLTPAAAPLRANTNVPASSSTSSVPAAYALKPARVCRTCSALDVGIIAGYGTGSSHPHAIVPRNRAGRSHGHEPWLVSLRQIRQRSDHQSLCARGQRRLDDRREELRMIGGDVLFHPPGRARAGVSVCADSADSPVGIGRAQGVRDIAEVFAGGLMAEVEERAGREMASERGRGPLRGVGVVIGEWVLIVVVELRGLRCARCFAFRVDHALDALDHPLAYRQIVGPQIGEEHSVVRDDVALRAGYAAADGQDRELTWLRLARDDRLQAKDD